MMNNLIDNFKGILDDEREIASQKSLEADEMARLAHENQMANAFSSIESAKMDLRQELGAPEYDKIYTYLKAQRSRPNVNEEKMFNEIQKAVQGNKYKMTLIFKLDGIVFNELLQTGV